MRKIQATKEQSELRRLTQAYFHLLASERENTRDLVLPNCADASSCAGEPAQTPDWSQRSRTSVPLWTLSQFDFTFSLLLEMLGDRVRAEVAGGGCVASAEPDEDPTWCSEDALQSLQEHALPCTPQKRKQKRLQLVLS